MSKQWIERGYHTAVIILSYIIVMSVFSCASDDDGITNYTDSGTGIKYHTHDGSTIHWVGDPIDFTLDWSPDSIGVVQGVDTAKYYSICFLIDLVDSLQGAK